MAVTTGMVGLLSARELRGVLAQEIAQIKNRDILVCSVSAALASAITSVANALQFSTLSGGGSQEEARRARARAPTGSVIIRSGL